MQVVKRDLSKENVKFEKILRRISGQSKDLKNVDSVIVAQKVIQGIFDGITTKELDSLAIDVSYAMSIQHPEYDKLAVRLYITSLHKDTPPTFLEATSILENSISPDGVEIRFLDKTYVSFIRKHAHILDSVIDYSRDFNFEFFGLKTLDRSYLLKKFGKVVERPQHLWMRVSCGIHCGDLDSALETYELLSTKQATHATPTLFNAGTVKNQLSSCFLQAMKEDSIEGIYETLKDCAKISQTAGGIGLHVHNIRSRGSYIYGTGGKSNGLVPMLRNFNETARFIDQGGGRRKGSYAIFLEPWHADILEFIELRKNTGKEEIRARDLNLGLWCPDLFFQRVEEDGIWSLMDPNISKGLSDVYGEEFNNLYTKYELEEKFVRQIKARDLWTKILDVQIETGEPYIMAKDRCNLGSNQKNLGTIKSSNLCCEIIEYSSQEETAVCNLASISLPACLEEKKAKKVFNFDKLREVTKALVRNLDKIIDIEFYPIPQAKKSNKRHRPIGIGVQGLADVFAILRYSWDSEEASKLNKQIFEHMYFAGIEESCKLARERGSYESIQGSPISEGIFQFDLFGVNPISDLNWEALRLQVKESGIRNSLLFALMPTASSSNILGNTECFEPITSNIYKRGTLSGEFIQVNKYLVKDLMSLDLWTDEIRQKIIACSGSIQYIEEIPQNIKNLYKTVWEISQKIIIDFAADRQPFVCQSQSMNLYFKNPDYSTLTSAYFYGWKKGLKTIVYYTRTRAAREAIKFTVNRKIEEEMNKAMCSVDNPEDCEMCSS
jgi:ribonucleoside-diphosphate reductase alpha chain